MKNFHFACPGEIFFGAGSIEQNPQIFRRCGKKAFILTTEFPDGLENIALKDMTAVLDKEGIAYAINVNTIPDPPVESAIEILEHVKEFDPDFLIGIGGGSTMDTVKSINILLNYPGADAYDILFGKGPHVFAVGGPNEGKLPFISVATTAGSGADITGVGVMTRADIDNKAGTNRRNYADYVFVDPRYIENAPKKLNQATAVDALCHGIEAYVSTGSRDNFMTNFISERAFSLFSDYKYNLLNHTMTSEDYEKQMLHSMLQGIVIVNEVTGVPHGLGYPLSHYYHVPHGLACGVFEGEYLRIFEDQERVQKVVSLLGFKDIDEFCDYIQDILTPHIDLKVTRKEIEEWTEVFCNTQWRLDRHPEPLTTDMVRGMYERALKKFIVD